MKRRAFVAGGAATLFGSTAYAISTGSSEASETTLGELHVPDVSTKTGGDSIQSVNISVDASWSYDTNVNPDKWTLELLIGDNDSTLEPIDSVEQTENLLQTDSGTETLSGSVTSEWHFSNSSFEPVDNGTKDTVVYVGLSFKLHQGGDVIAESELVEPVTVSVDGQELTASASLGGSGEISIST
jgi:hypothetical protein